MNKAGCETEKARLKASFESATSCAEMYEALGEMVNSGLFEENELGFEYHRISKKFVQEGHDPLNFLFMISSGGTTGTEAELKRAFYTATSVDEMVRAFKNMEQHIKEENLGIECCVFAEKLFEETREWEKVLLYGERGLKYFIGREDNTDRKNNMVLLVANLTRMLGMACRELGRSEESISYLERCVRNLSVLESANFFHDELGLDKLIDVHSELSMLKCLMGRLDEAYNHMGAVVKIQGKKKLQCCVEQGVGNNDMADMCLGDGRFKEAFPFLLKTVEIYDVQRLANDPKKLALLKRSLGIMYCGMKEYGKATEIGSSESGLKLVEEVESANELFVLGKFEEGEASMKAVISHGTAQGADFTKASVFVALARGLCNKEKFGAAKKCLEIAQRIVETKQINHMVLAAVLEKSTKMYEEMEEIETEKR